MGCHCSKTAGVVEPAANTGGGSITVLDPAEPQAPPKPQTEEAASPLLKVAVLAVEGIRHAGGVFVEVELEGKPETKVATPVASASTRMHGLGESARQTSDAHLKCELALKDYPAGTGITLTVRDSDLTKTEPLGRATLPALMIQSEYWGKIPLSDAGEGYDASLEVRVGERHILVETAQAITNAVTDAVEGVQEVVGEAKQELDVVAGATTKDVQKGVQDLSMTEVQEAVSHGVGDASNVAQEALREAKYVLSDNAGQIREVVGDGVEEVQETHGSVCCRC